MLGFLFRKLEQSSLYDQENREGSVPTAAGALCNPGKSSPYHTENKEVSVPTTAGTERRLEQSSLHDPSVRQLWIHWIYTLPERSTNHDILQYKIYIEKKNIY
jgi:hypothetical protein